MLLRPPARRPVTAPRDALEVAGVVAREGVPERAGRTEDRELLALIERKRDVDEERQSRRDQADAERAQHNAEVRDADCGLRIAGCGLRTADWGLEIANGLSGLHPAVRTPRRHGALEYPMPLFEYECRGCGKRFEYLTRDGQSPSLSRVPERGVAEAACRCSRRSRARRQSRSRDRPMQASAGGGCGACGDPRGPGACSMN